MAPCCASLTLYNGQAIEKNFITKYQGVSVKNVTLVSASLTLIFSSTTVSTKSTFTATLGTITS